MNDAEIIRQRANLLAQARIQLNEDYQKRRAEQYSKWQVESNHLWVTKGILLPYPSSFGYPTEEEVVARALELYNKQHNPTALPKTEESMTSSVTTKLNEVSQKVTPVTLPEVPKITPWEQYLTPEVVEAEQNKTQEQQQTSTVPKQPLIPQVPAAPSVLSKPALEFPPLATVELEPIPAKEAEPKDEPDQKEETVTSELEQAIDDVLSQEESTTADKKQTSKLRSLLAQFVTIAKKLDSDKPKEETK